MQRLMMAVAALVMGSAANAAMITYTDTQLASGNPVTVGGTTLTTSTVGGNIGFIGAGTFTGLHLGGDQSSGLYTLAFSDLIDSIEIEFDALSDVGPLPVETLFDFATNNGAVSIGYTNQFGTTFDGSTITSTENDGQGIITFSGAAFSSFSFNHDQGAQNGFVIERLKINTVTDVPEPGMLALLGVGIAALGIGRRRKG